jgi:hypothetical protein
MERGLIMRPWVGLLFGLPVLRTGSAACSV